MGIIFFTFFSFNVSVTSILALQAKGNKKNRQGIGGRGV
jgi:hypothetical protein